MPALPLAHLSWALADNALRPACDAFFIDLFGAETAYEMLVTPETEAMGLDREERLMMIGDTMLIPIAAAGRGADPESPIGQMLRRSAGENRWLGVSLRVADLAKADKWFRAKGFKLHYDPGMESHYFLLARWQVMGMRVEIMTGELPNDPRLKPGWNPGRWATDHPLGIIGLQAIGLSAPSLAEAHALFAERLEMPALGQRFVPADNADCAAFDLGDTVIEALTPRDPDSPLAQHLANIQGICAITFRVRDAAAAHAHLLARGFTLIGDVADRFAIAPAQAQGRLIWFTGNDVPGYPPLGTKMTAPTVYPD
ncbi:MAG: VOC family protein [Sphingomonadales bacterium]|nr:VOC family protein [Sphingomonadales bacterium]